MIPSALPWTLLFLGLAAYALAFWSWRTGRTSAAIACLMLGGLSLRLFAACDGSLHAWDERYHALVAKNLTAHPLRPTLYDTPLIPFDDRNWVEAHVWLHKPPLALWLMALSMALFGVSELALRMPSVLLSTAAIYVVYRLGAAWRGPEVGLLAAFFQSVNAFLILLAAGWVATDHVDTAIGGFVALAVMTVAIGGPGSRAFGALGLLSGLAVLSKGLPGLLPLPVGLLWQWGRERPAVLAGRVALALSACLAVALPWWLYTALTFPAQAAWERSYDLRHLVEPLEGTGHSIFFHLARLPRIYGELIYVPLAWFAWTLVRPGGPQGSAGTRPSRWREPGTSALAAWILLPYGVFSLAASKMPAYVMIAAPAVFLVQAAFCARLREHWRGGSRLRRLALGLLLAGVALLPVRIVLNDLRLFRPHDRHPAWATELRDLNRRLAGTRAVIFGSQRPIETMFYTSQTAYPSLPERTTAEALRRQGYRVLIYETPDLPVERRGWPGVEYLPPPASEGR